MNETQGSKSRLEATIDGRVQGVSFRYYTVRRARDLGLGGYVRNEPDGTVTVVAEGQRSDLEELLSFLRVGPRAAVVTDVRTDWHSARGDFGRFEVRY
jgi:acylphosphatase